jgi:hypothetical protein
MAKVQISWQRFKWPVGCNWKSFQQQLEQAKVTEKELARSVYVIRGNGLFTISYMKGSSPTLYIGEGNFKQRIAQHKKWFEPLIKLVGGEFPLSIYVSTPRVRNNKIIYRDMEAALIEEIISIYGCLPFRNKQKETRLFDCQYEPKETFRSVLTIGKGNRYLWALKPLPSNCFYDEYNRKFD